MSPNEKYIGSFDVMISGELEGCEYDYTRNLMSGFLMELTGRMDDAEFSAVCSHWYDELCEYCKVLYDMDVLRKSTGNSEPLRDKTLVEMVTYALSFIINQTL